MHFNKIMDADEREEAPPLNFITQTLHTAPVCLCDTAETEKAERASEMTTSCMRSTLEPEHRLMTQESTHHKEVLESQVDRNSEMKDDEKEEEEALYAENPEEDQLKKPRRKDTPILNSPPHIPGVRLLKAEKQTVHLEDEEKDVKD